MGVQRSPMGELEILIRGIDSPYSQDPKTPKNHQHKHQNFGIRGVPGDLPGSAEWRKPLATSSRVGRPNLNTHETSQILTISDYNMTKLIAKPGSQSLSYSRTCRT